jgi:transmembrane sensor
LAQVVTLIPGERLMLPPNAAATLDEPRIDTVTAWRRGEVVLEHTRLDEALTEMNRYEDRKLVISSPEIAHLEISGIYHVGDGAGFAATIAMLYHLQVTRTQSEILIAAPARPELRP